MTTTIVTNATSGAAHLPTLAKSSAVRRLVDSLEERGLHTHAATAIASAVCDPTSVRRQLTAPGRLRVDGGFLEVVQTEVWVPGVLAYPTNPRALPAFTYPIESQEGRRHPLPGLAPSPDADAVELLVPPLPSSTLIGAIDAQVQYLRRANDLRESVALLGIREPLLLIPLVIDLDWGDREQDGSRSVTDIDVLSAPAFLAAVDGSSRVTAAHFHLGIEPAETLHKFLGDERALRQKISNLVAKSKAEEDLTDEERARLQSLIAPASIIVGFIPDDPERDTLLKAINSRLGALHVDPPRPWSAASRLDVQLDVALDALVEAGRLDPIEAEWLAGRLTVEEIEELGFRDHPDVRAAYLLQQVGRTDSVTGKALRTLTARSRISVNLRADIAAEGALRSFRAGLNDTQAQAARSLLSAIYMMDEIQAPWSIDPTVSPGSVAEVRDRALKELRTQGKPSREIRVLLVQAGYWLARKRIVPRQTRGGQEDRRDITTILSLMANSEHGVRQLIQIIKDGRADLVPRRVTATGKLNLPARKVTDAWLRETWADGVTNSKLPELSPEAELNEAAGKVRTAITDLKEKVEALKNARVDAGPPLVETEGLEPTLAQAMLVDLFHIQTRLAILKHVGEVHHTERPTDEDDDDQLDGADE